MRKKHLLFKYPNSFPFGMLMPNRSENSSQYRYSFQGQEKDDELKGQGNSINYKYRMHDPRIGRFFAVDPLAPDYPHNSPYAFSENRVIDGIELEGLEYATFNITIQNGKVIEIHVTKDYELKRETTRGAGLQYNYIYLDDNGYVEKIEKDFKKNGKYDHGIYHGPNNPYLPVVGGSPNEKFYNYDLEPLDEADANAKEHDQNYDDIPAGGVFDALFNKKTLPADEILIEKSDDLIERSKNPNNIDAITKKPISSETVKAAKQASKGFKLLKSLFKDKPLPSSPIL